MSEKKPFEVARETIRKLTERKLAPTPLNYQRIYNEIAGLAIEPPFPADRLREIAHALPAKTPGQERQRALFESAIGQYNWDGIKRALVAYGGFAPAQDESSATRSAPLDAPQSRPIALEASEAAPALTDAFFAQIARLLEFVQPALAQDDARFNDQTRALLDLLRRAPVSALGAKQALADYAQRLSFAAEDQAEVRSMLLKLLHLLLENIAQLNLEEAWLKGQVEAVRNVCVPPLSLRRLDDVERRLKDVIFKQGEAKARALQAQEDMRALLKTFVERLAGMSASTSGFQSQLEATARQLEQAQSITDIAPVLQNMVSATQAMVQENAQTRDQLDSLRQRAQASEAELHKLHQELDRVSAQARHDPLTGALNRQGLDEAFAREVARVRRTDSPLCVALLDIDNFKQLNDRLGHASGDAALKHLAEVTRQAMRPQDTLARYGGEEFVILLPDTPQDKGVEAMTRLQRELTKRFFMAGEEKVLITFSAGVAQFQRDESAHEATQRADQAMYLAKRSGKNRVLAG